MNFTEFFKHIKTVKQTLRYPDKVEVYCVDSDGTLMECKTVDIKFDSTRQCVILSPLKSMTNPDELPL